MVKTYHIELDGKSYEVGIEQVNGRFAVTLGGKKSEVDLVALNGGGALSILLDGRSYDLEVKESEKGLSVFALGQHYNLLVEEEKLFRARQLSSAGKSASQEKVVRAPMPGLVVKIEVAVGQMVAPGQGLLVMEAMKMENEIKAIGSGRVKEIKVVQRQPVEQNQILITFE
ncbi:MAG: biotin/lipoyl-containing protein [Limisphaerales bacterium]